MSKRILINGVYHRWRRGVLVPIPDKWVGKTTDRQTIRKRRSKLGRQARENESSSWKSYRSGNDNPRKRNHGPTIEEFD
jgi:hypothetical protein